MEIQGIELTDSHKGEEVTYLSSNKIEGGVISSWNDTYVFVRYGEGAHISDNTAQATKPNDLYWGNRESELRTKQKLIDSMKFNDLISPIDITKLSRNGLFYDISINDIIDFKLECFLDVSDGYMIIYQKEEEKLEKIKREFKINRLLK